MLRLVGVEDLLTDKELGQYELLRWAANGKALKAAQVAEILKVGRRKAIKLMKRLLELGLIGAEE